MSALLATTSSSVSHETIERKWNTISAEYKYVPLPVNDVVTRINSIELKPIYQRDIKWNSKAACELILAVMEGEDINVITIYTYHADDEEFGKGKKYECLDGQHRLRILYHFFKSEPIVIGGKKQMIHAVHKDKDRDVSTVLFYEKNSHTISYEKKNRTTNVGYFSTKEQKKFKESILNIKKIEGKLTILQRTEIFNSLSKGKNISGGDKLKNINKPLIRFMRDNHEKKMKEIIENNCTQKSQMYSMHWLLRLFEMMKNDNVENFLIKDSKFSEIMNKEELNISDEERIQFNLWFSNFSSFLSKTSYEVTPTHIFCLFIKVNRCNEIEKEMILSHIWRFKDEKYNTFWETKKRYLSTKEHIKQRAAYYDEVKMNLDNINSYLPELDERPITQNLKHSVWELCNGKTTEGKCFCCKNPLKQRDCIYGHIIPRRFGGRVEIDNIRSICSGCNSEMKTENMYKWMESKGFEIILFNQLNKEKTKKESKKKVSIISEDEETDSEDEIVIRRK
jgi:5-methylcytosine-specific restriction endonuclease McrA